MPEFCLLPFHQWFSTIQPHLLLKKLLFGFELSPPLAMWILGVLLERPQRMRMNDCLSDTVCISTGSLRGCVPPPLPLILYTSCSIETICVLR